MSAGEPQSIVCEGGRLRRKLLIAGAVFIIIATGLYVQLHILKKHTKAGMAAIKAKGLPVSLAELNPFYSVPPYSDNAADFYEQAFNALIPYDRGSTNAPGQTETALGASYPPRTILFLTQWIATNEPTLKLLHEGARHPFCRYSLDYSKGFDTLLPHLAQAKSCVQLLAWDALLRAESHDLNGAIDSLESAMAVADSLANEPDIISQLVRIAGHSIVTSRFEEILNLHSFSRAQLIRIGRLFEGRESPGNLRRAFAGELCMGMDLFDNPSRATAVFTGRMPGGKDHCGPSRDSRTSGRRTLGERSSLLREDIHRLYRRGLPSLPRSSEQNRVGQRLAGVVPSRTAQLHLQNAASSDGRDHQKGGATGRIAARGSNRHRHRAFPPRSRWRATGFT